MPEPTMSLDDFAERYIKPAMKNLADMEPEELIAAIEKNDGFRSFYEYVLAVKYGVGR